MPYGARHIGELFSPFGRKSRRGGHGIDTNGRIQSLMRYGTPPT